MNIGMCSITTAELWGIYQGLLLAWDRGIRLLMVEVDSLCVTQLLQRRDDIHNACYPLVKGIQELLSRSWQISVKHIYREANFAADFLANFALSLPLGLHVFSNPPDGVNVWLRNDGVGIAFPRFVKP